MPSPAPPKQARSIKTLDRILAAARDLFAEQGETGFTIPAVSERAGTSIGAIYRRFATKEDLLIAVLERIQQQEQRGFLTEWADRDWSGLDRRAMIDRLICDLASTWREQGPLMRAMMSRRLAKPDDEVFEHGSGVAHQQTNLFELAIMSHQAEIAHPNPAQAIDFSYRLIIGACARWTANAIETKFPEPMSWDAMLANLGDVIETYLFGTALTG